MKDDRPGSPIAADDQGARIVAEQGARHPTEWVIENPLWLG